VDCQAFLLVGVGVVVAERWYLVFFCGFDDFCELLLV
jgi:hypothetical protein